MEVMQDKLSVRLSRMVGMAPTRPNARAFCSSADKMFRVWSAVEISGWDVGCNLISVRMEVMSRLGRDWMVANDGCADKLRVDPFA
jgi:hypothetical protein